MDMPLVTTTEIGFAATLLTLGFNIDGIDPQNPRRVVFYFQKTPDLDRAIDNYNKKKIRVEPQDYEVNRGLIVGKIYESKSNQKPSQNGRRDHFQRPEKNVEGQAQSSSEY